MSPRVPIHEPYKVWRPDVETEEGAREVGAFDARSAAENHASHCHRHRDGWEWSWPITFHVRAHEDDRVYAVEVEREMVPEFVAGKPVVLR